MRAVRCVCASSARGSCAEPQLQSVHRADTEESSTGGHLSGCWRTRFRSVSIVLSCVCVLFVSVCEGCWCNMKGMMTS